MESLDYYNSLKFLYENNSEIPFGVYQENNKRMLFKLFFDNAKYSIRYLFRNEDILNTLNVDQKHKINWVIINSLIRPESKIEFIIVDSKSFWFHDTDRKIAWAKFNNPKECKKLIKYFDEAGMTTTK